MCNSSILFLFLSPFSDSFLFYTFVNIGKNYDEFKAFVACSQLKPIQGSELGQLVRRPAERALSTTRNSRTGIVQQKQTSRNKSLHVGNSISLQSEENGVSGGNSPRTGSLLEKEWRQRCQTFPEKALYMHKKLSPSTFIPIYQKASLDPSFMSDLISVIHQIIFVDVMSSEVPYDRTTYVLEWMEAFPQCTSFHLNLLFMNSCEKNSVHQIIDWIDQSLRCDTKYEQRVKMLKSNYGVNN